MITRKDVAAQLFEMARLLDVLGEDPHRARSLFTAGRTIEAFQGDIAELQREGRLTELRGVGVRTEHEIDGLFAHGVMPTLAELRERVPDEVLQLFTVSGLGARRIGQLWRSGIGSIEELIAACDDGRLAELPGFGPKSVANLREAAVFAAQARRRMRLDEAERLAEAILSALRAELPAARSEVTGEYRRRLETVERVEILVGGVSTAEITEFASRLLDEPSGSDPLTGRLMDKGVRLLPTDLREFGAALAVTTGNDEYVRWLEERARERDVELGTPAGVDLPGSEEEPAFLASLGVPWVEPELREGRDPVPVEGLVELADIRGAVHNHSTWSDGALPIRGMVQAARRLGFAYLAMADHSQTSTVANGLTPERVLAQGAEIRALREELHAAGSDFGLLHGMEVDILPDGSLDLPDEILAGLDYVVASVHQNFTLSRARQTRRIVRAVENPHVHILGHPTGRLLLRRPPYEVDLQQVIEACAATGTVIEINANPRRLDLDWRWVIRARELGCRFSINPDAHTADGFDDVRYGVMVARKAGLRAVDVVNTAATGAEFLARLKGS